MSGSVAPARTLPKVRRDYEVSRLTEQLLALAYEQLLPIIHTPRRETATDSATGTHQVPLPLNKEVPEYAHH